VDGDEEAARRRATMAGLFLDGHTKYSVGHVLGLWIRHKSGRAAKARHICSPMRPRCLSRIYAKSDHV